MKIRLPYSLSRSTAMSSSDSPKVRGKKMKKAQLRQQNLSSLAQSEENNSDDDREQTPKKSTISTLPAKKSTYLARKFGQKQTPKTKDSTKSTSPSMKATQTRKISGEDDWDQPTDSTRSNRSTLAAIKESDVTKNFGNDNWDHFPTMKDSTRSTRSTSVAMKDSTRSNRSVSMRSTRSTTSASMATASEIHRSQYEHWKVNSDGDGGCQDGCRAGCTDGKETVSAFSDAVTEVFDLINEVAFPEILDAVAEAEEKQSHLNCGSSSYNEDDDSVFNRSEDYNKNKQAKEFLGFIGAVKPSTKKIITPMAPSALLKPDGNPLSLASKDPSPVQVMTTPFALISTIPLRLEREDSLITELKAKEKEDEVEVQTRLEKEAETRDDNGNKMEKEDDNSIVERPIVERPTDENSQIIRTSWCRKDVRRKSPDRYSSLDGTFSSSSDEWENVDDSATIDNDDNNNDDWSNTDSKTTAEDDFKNYIEGVVNKKDGEQQTGFHQSFNRDKPKYSKPRPVCGTEPPELLTIVESSGEDATTSEEEDNRETKKDVANVDDKVEETKKVDPVAEVEFLDDVDEKVKRSGEAGHPDEVKPDDKVVPSNESKRKDKDEEANVRKLNVHREEDYCSSAVSGSDVSSYDDRSYLSYTGSEDESFLDFEEKSVTSHTNLYSIGVHDSNSGAADVSSFELTGYSDDDTFDNNAVIQKMSVEESLLQDDSSEEETEEYDSQPSSFAGITPSTFCSVYDNLYPADSIFSFTTQEESTRSLFDFGNSTTLAKEAREVPSSILTEEESSLEPPSSMLPKESSVEEDDDEDVPAVDEEIDVPQEEHEDEIQDESKRQFLKRSMMLAQDQVHVQKQEQTPKDRPEEDENRVEDDEANIEENVDAKDNEEGGDSISVDLKNDEVEDTHFVEKEIGGECEAGEEEEHGEEKEKDGGYDDEEKDVDYDDNDNDNDNDNGDVDDDGEGDKRKDEDDKESKSPSDTQKKVSILPPRQHQGARDEAPTNPIPTLLIEGKTVKDEHSNSNRSRTSNSSNESTMDTDKVDAGTATDINHLKSSFRSSNKNDDRQTAKRRHLSRLKMYNQHRQNLLKLQHKAE